MRIAICDDEKSMGQILEEKVKKLLPDAVVEKYLSGDDLISSGFKPDILFMDIQMPGKDGMETARIVRQNNKDMILIFVTAVEEYVFQAFDVGAFHYLVKPFLDDKFEEVVKRAIKTIREQGFHEWKEIIPLTERRAFSDGKKLFHGQRERISLTGKAGFTAKLASY